MGPFLERCLVKPRVKQIFTNKVLRVYECARELKYSIQALPRYSFMITLNDTFDNLQESKYNI